MTIYIQPAVIIIFLLFGLACFLLGFVLGRPDKHKDDKQNEKKYITMPRHHGYTAAQHIVDEMHDYRISISCSACKRVNCLKCETEGMYKGYEPIKRGDSHV